MGSQQKEKKDLRECLQNNNGLQNESHNWRKIQEDRLNETAKPTEVILT